MENKNKNKNNIINSYLHVENNLNDPINWMKIKDENTNDILLNIPYTLTFVEIKSYMDAVNKQAIILKDSLYDCYQTMINEMYEKYPKILLSETLLLKLKTQNVTLNIDLTKYEISYTQLYFLQKINSIGFIHFIDKNKMTIIINKDDFSRNRNDDNNHNRNNDNNTNINNNVINIK